MPDEAAFMSLVLLCLQLLPGERTAFISAAALKAPPRGREWICMSKKPILCLDRPMFLRSKHRVVNVKEVNVPSKNLNYLDINIYVLN